MLHTQTPFIIPLRRITISYCSTRPVLNALTLSRSEPTSTRKQHGKGHADYLLAICQGGARARASVLCVRACGCVCARARARSVRVFTGRTSERRGRSLTNIGFTHWKQPPITFLHTRRGSLRHRSPSHSSAQERNPHTLWILFFFLDFNA